jgi:hypothetical protein
MRWLGATVGLLAACVALVGWIYLRDHSTESWHPPAGQAARADAATVLAALDGDGCRHHCGVQLLGSTRHGDWIAQITLGAHPQCFAIDVAAFSNGQHGLTGVEPVSCERTG